MANLVAESGGNKGQLSLLIEAICRDFRQHDEAELKKLVEWQRQVKTKGANKEKPAARLQGLQRLLSVNEIGRKSAQWDRLLRAPALPEGTSRLVCSVRTAREVP